MRALDKKMFEQMQKGKNLHDQSLAHQKQNTAVLGGNVITGLMLNCEKRMAMPALSMLSEQELNDFQAAAEHSIELIEQRKAELKLIDRTGANHV